MKGGVRIYFAGQDVPPEIESVSPAHVWHRLQFCPPVTFAWWEGGQWHIWAPYVRRFNLLLTIRRSDSVTKITIEGAPTTFHPPTISGGFGGCYNYCLGVRYIGNPPRQRGDKRKEKIRGWLAEARLLTNSKEQNGAARPTP